MFPASKKKSRQFGGTFLGIVVGVVVGLGAALAVAVYVTKVPIPFMNRNSSRNAEQDALEAQKNRDWDPNSVLGKRSASGARPLGGDSGAAPAGAAAGVVPPQAPRPDPMIPAAPPAPASAAATPSPAPRPPAASSDPLGDLARARSANAPATSTAAAPPAAPVPGNSDGFDYLIQAGAFRTQADAEAQRARLAIMGWEARVTEREQAGRTVYRVRIGPFVRRDDAERLKDTLDTSGMESSLVRVQR